MSATFQPDGAPPAKSSSTVKIVLIVLAVILLLVLLVCGGLAALRYFGFNRMQEMAGEEFKAQLVGNPVIEEELGEIQSMRLDFQEITARAGENQGEPVLIFQIDGSKADGTLIAVPDNSGSNQMASATLETEDGRTVDVPLAGDTELLESEPAPVIEPAEPEAVEIPE